MLNRTINKKMNKLKSILSGEDISLRFRVNILVSFLLYAFYGVVDYYMMPNNFIHGWVIRYLLVMPILIILFIVSYKKQFEPYIYKSSVALMVLGQVGIFIIMFFTQANERAYNEYYIGLTLVIFVAAFIYRLSSSALAWLSLFTIIVYNFYTINFLGLLVNGYDGPDFALFISSNTFIVMACVLAWLGKYIIENFQEKIQNEKIVLQKALVKAKESDDIKSSFLNTMSHELRTPLNGIIGLSGLLLEDPDLEESNTFIKSINNQGNHLFDILSSMLYYTQLQTVKDLGEKKEAQLSTFEKELKNTFHFHQNKLNKNHIKFESHIPNLKDGISINTYFEKIYKCLDAIIENSLKFSEDGTIKLDIRIINNMSMVISIADEGIGIEEGMEMTIFRDFSQVETKHNRTYSGIGMGLSISKKIISLLDGEIWYEKNQAKGTIFHVLIPNVIVDKNKEEVLDILQKGNSTKL